MTDPSYICAELNKDFCSVGHKMTEPNNSYLTTPNPHTSFGQRISNFLFFEPTNCDETINIIDCLNSIKATGFDDIWTTLIKATKNNHASYLINIFNSLHKKRSVYGWTKNFSSYTTRESKTDLKNYWPISILPAFNKIIEIIIERRLVEFWNKHNVFVPMQFGFCEFPPRVLS